MKKIIYVLLLILIYSCSNILVEEKKVIKKTEKTQTERIHDIRVKITNIPDKDNIVIKSNDFFEINDKKYLQINIKKVNDKLIFNGEQFDDIYLKNNSIINLNGNKYYGDFLFKIKDNQLLIINKLDIEKYLEGVLPFEMPASFPLEALKAQAIIARTYAYYKINNKKDDFDLDDTIKFQVYKGKVPVNIDNTIEAIKSTKDLVITYNDKLIDALFHSYSGGYTASAKEVYDNDIPYLVAVEDSYSEDVDKNLLTWTIEINNKKLIEKIGFIPDEYVLEYSPTNRVVLMNLKNNKESLELSGRKFRQLFGLKSTSFVIEKQEDKILVIGSGFGHGVGFSQWSSKTMANTYSMNYEEIIKFFYKNVDIKTKEN